MTTPEDDEEWDTRVIRAGDSVPPDWEERLRAFMNAGLTIFATANPLPKGYEVRISVDVEIIPPPEEEP